MGSSDRIIPENKLEEQGLCWRISMVNFNSEKRREKRSRSPRYRTNAERLLKCILSPIKMPPTKLDGIARAHPVLPLVLSKKEPATNANIPAFIEHEMANHPDGRIPYNLSDFYGDYLDYVIVKELREKRNEYAPKHYRWNIRDTVDRISKAAYLHHVRSVKISESVLKKVLALPKEKPILSGNDESDPEDLDFRTFGLFAKESTDLGQTVYTFKETVVLEYLVAHYQALECLRKVAKSKEGKGEEWAISTALKDSMRRLPATGDIWRITFGLLNMDQSTREVQKSLLEELIEEAKNNHHMSSFDITSLCVESIYESQNVGDLAQLIDEFTLNETINYSSVQLAHSRYPYTIHSVGYLVRASPTVYGLHMANFNLNEERLTLLADPVNAVSDNNLQVLNLSHNPMGQKGMRKLQRFIVKATLLTHLDISDCQIGGMGLALLSEFFMCLPLRYLRVSDNNINDKGFIHFCSNLHYLTTLEWLDASGNNLTDKSVVKLGDAIKGLPNFKCLDLRRNQIGDDGANAISEALETMPNVSHVMLSENQIGEAGAEQLANHATKTRTLRYINLSLNNIPAAGVLELKKAEEDHGELTIQIGSQSVLDDSTFLDTTGVSEGSMTFHRASSLEPAAPPRDWERSVSMDLLAGRPDKDKSINHREMMRRHQSLPRMTDFRRSFQSTSHSFRDSMRSLGSGSLGRSSYRSNAASRNGSIKEGLSNSKKSIGDSFKRTGDTLRRSTGNLKDSMRSRSASFRDTLRNSFRRGSGERREQNNQIEASPTPSPAPPSRPNGTTTTV